MARLSEFLGELVSGISDARVKSDIRSVKIAEEYAGDKLRQHFAVPRMRVSTVELNIPVAIDKLNEKIIKVYEPINNQRFSSITYKQILQCLELNKLSKKASLAVRNEISDHVQLLEAKINVDQTENALDDFSKNIALKIIELKDLIFADTKTKPLSNLELSKLQDSITKGLNDSLQDEIKSKTEFSVIDSLHVIVEADKLREVKPNNVIMIKMTISEQGMEWIKMENSKGEVINKLMPE